MDSFFPLASESGELLMNSASMAHPLFQVLMEEHKKILSKLAQIDLSPRRDQWLPLLDEIMQLIEMDHHFKEEKLLFSRIYMNPKINAGGPMCSLFFDFHMSEKIKEQVECITSTPLMIEPHQEDILKTHCPLTLPIEEHQAGKDLLKYIIKNMTHLKDKEISQYLSLYKQIQFSHIQKEENCLYHLCSNLLTSQEADEILELWNQKE
jgi:hemerythrin-like domain-containing protein